MTYRKLKESNISFIFLLVILAFPILNSCEEEDDELVGNWTSLSDLDGLPRADAVGFSIGNKGYIGTGYDSDNERLKDFWEYDPVRNTWTQKADLPGVERNSAVGFSTDTKGYIGTGFDGKNKLKDFYEYDPSANTWTQKADFAGNARYGAVGMGISNKGYIGTGYDGNYMKDFWEYNPETDTWTQKTSIGGSKRRDAATFVIEGKGYLMTGIDNGIYENDVWEYDPSTDIWTEKREIENLSDDSYDDSYSTITGIDKAGFTINGKGYLATGGTSAGEIVWEYNPSSDLWTERTSFEGSSRTGGVGFDIDNVGYVTTGKSGSYYYDDLWSFDPLAEYDEND